MSKIPTAEEFCNERLGFEQYGTDVPYFMIEFTKFHVEAALKKASEKVIIEDDPFEYELDENSILNAYPLENIK